MTTWDILQRNAEENASILRKINPYELRGQEVKIEEGKRAQRKIFNWKRGQQQKLEKNTEVLDVSDFPRKTVLNETQNKKKQINTQEQITNKVVKKSIRTVCISEMKKFSIFCLEKRQPSM